MQRGGNVAGLHRATYSRRDERNNSRRRAGGGGRMAALKKIEVIVFPGGNNWGIWTAQANGFFAKRGVEVNLTPTPGSEFQMTNLHAGKFDVAMTAIDNVVAYQEAQGPVALDHPDFFAFMGTDNGFLTLVAAPEIKTIAQLKGRTLSVDAMTTGYAFVLRYMLEKNGIGVGDVTYATSGGVVERWAALQEKKHVATLLVSPFDLIAKAKGFTVLGRAVDIFGAYQGGVGAAKRAWARANPTALVGFIGGYREGVAWLYDRANKAKAIELLRARMPNVDATMAEAIYGVLLAERGGLYRDAAIDMPGVATVLKLRSAYAEPRKTLTDASKYIDLTYYAKAVQG
jgi:ABC-type nitrate/sulfonate/bicarbonate transport system substrate-binding protein